MLTIETAQKIQSDDLTRVDALTAEQLVHRVEMLLSHLTGGARQTAYTAQLCLDTFRAMPLEAWAECEDVRAALKARNILAKMR